MSPPTRTRRHRPDFFFVCVASIGVKAQGEPEERSLVIPVRRSERVMYPYKQYLSHADEVGMDAVCPHLCGCFCAFGPDPAQAHSCSCSSNLSKASFVQCGVGNSKVRADSVHVGARHVYVGGLSMKVCVRVGSWFLKGSLRTWKIGNTRLAAEPRASSFLFRSRASIVRDLHGLACTSFR